jgi:hypothetical protein
MTAAALIAEARAAGVQLHLVGDNGIRWRCSGPPPSHLLARLRDLKGDVIAALREEGHKGHGTHWADEAQRWRDAYEEKAAIREHDGGLSRDEAEAAALLDMAARWRSENPLPASDRAACCHCDKPAPCTSILAGAQGEHAWLHRECWAPMNERRQREALDAVTRLLNASKKDA